MRIQALALALPFLVLVAGCGDPGSTVESSEDGLVDQASSDVAVLKVQLMESLNGNGSPDFDRDRCAPLPEGRIDCTAQLRERFGAPALHQVALQASSNQFYCKVLHVTTVSKRDAHEASSGIGFFYRGYAGEGRFVAASDLKKVGDTTLKSGEPGVLHEFTALAGCWLGSGSSSSFARYDFKPYMQFEANGEVYRNWEDVSRDHTVTGSQIGWDRSADLLQ